MKIVQYLCNTSEDLAIALALADLYGLECRSSDPVVTVLVEDDSILAKLMRASLIPCSIEDSQLAQ